MAYQNDNTSDQNPIINKSNAITHFFNGLTISRKLGLGFGLLILLMVIFGSISFYLIRLEDAALRQVTSRGGVTALTEQMRTQMQETDRLTETFLEQNKTERFEVVFVRYIRPSLIYIQTIRDLNKRSEAIGKENRVIKSSTDHYDDLHIAIDAQLDQYEQLLNRIVEKTRQRDLKDSGTEARFLAAAQSLQESSAFESDKQFRDTLMLLRRYEQWILRTGEFNDSYIVDGAVDKLRGQVAALDLNDSEKVALLGFLDEYLDAFHETLVLDTEVAEIAPVLPPTNEAILTLIDELDRLEETTENETVVQVEALANQIILAQIGLLVGTVAVAGVLAFIFARSITGPVAHLAEVARQVAQGDLSARATVSTQDEIGQFADIFNNTTAQLSEIVNTLESRVAARTQQIETVVEVSQRLTGILDLAELTRQVVNLTKETFNYYHTHIYLLNDEGDKLVMAEGYGQAGAQMKQAGHSIRFDAPTSLVARAARTNEIVWVDDVRQAEDWLPNPLLPDTVAEMAVPIVVEEQVVGVLDVQADQAGGLDEGDANLLRSLSNQVAVAIRNARLFQQVETALAENQATQARYVEQAWQKGKIMAGRGRYIYTRPGALTPAEAGLLETPHEAINQKQPPVSSGNGHRQAGKSLVVPLHIHDTMIGALQLHPGDDDQRDWSEDDLAIIQAVVDQFVQTAETLRLFDETQQRAGWERLIAEISDKMRRASDMEKLMKTVVGELSNVFDTDRIFVQLTPPVEPEPKQNGILNGDQAGPTVLSASKDRILR